MRVYLIRMIPHDGMGDVELRCSDDDMALRAAADALREVRRDATPKSRPPPTDLEVIRDDGTIIGLVTAEDSKSLA
jgi:hypothetical protein